jgi:septum formation protein
VKLYLASQSARRRELLTLLGVGYELLDAAVDESPLKGEAPREYVVRLARAKAEAGWLRLEYGAGPPEPVLGADTTVALGEHIFGKPADRREAAEMLTALSGKTHEVLTGIALRHSRGIESTLSVSEVTFRVLSEEDLERYLATGEWEGKAGAYAVQAAAARFVTGLRGSFTGVMGLPLCETARLLGRIAQ